MTRNGRNETNNNPFSLGTSSLKRKKKKKFQSVVFCSFLWGLRVSSVDLEKSSIHPYIYCSLFSFLFSYLEPGV